MEFLDDTDWPMSEALFLPRRNRDPLHYTQFPINEIEGKEVDWRSGTCETCFSVVGPAEISSNNGVTTNGGGSFQQFCCEL